MFYIDENNELWIKILKESNKIRITNKLSIIGIILTVISVFILFFGTIVIFSFWVRKKKFKEENNNDNNSNNDIINNNDNNNINNNFGYIRREIEQMSMF